MELGPWPSASEALPPSVSYIQAADRVDPAGTLYLHQHRHLLHWAREPKPLFPTHNLLYTHAQAQSGKIDHAASLLFS